MTAIRDIIVDSLFSVFVTAGEFNYLSISFLFFSLTFSLSLSLSLGTIPVIRCPRGNAAEMIAETLDKKIRDNLRDPRNSMFTGDGLSVSQLRYIKCIILLLYLL